MEKFDFKDKFIEKTRFFSAWKEERKQSVTELNRHEGYEIIAVLNGKCYFRIEDRNYTLTKNDVLFIAEGEYHRSIVPKECSLFICNFRPNLVFCHPEIIQLFLRPFMNGMNGGLHKIQNDKRLVRIISTLSEGKDGMVAVLQRVMGILDYFSKIKLPRYNPRIQEMKKRIQPAIDHIFLNFNEDISVKVLAKKCALSVPSFYRFFYSASNKSPINYLNETRIEQAKVLLVSTRRKISDIAFSVGFSNLSFFNRLFLKLAGITPSDYQKSNVPLKATGR
jgi:AraC-like DNA-binding protein